MTIRRAVCSLALALSCAIAPPSLASSDGDGATCTCAVPCLTAAPAIDCRVTVKTETQKDAGGSSNNPWPWVFGSVVALMAAALASYAIESAKVMRQATLDADSRKLALREPAATGAGLVKTLQAHCQVIIDLQEHGHVPEVDKTAAESLAKACKEFLEPR